MSNELPRHPSIPKNVKIEIPGNKSEADRLRANVRDRLNAWIQTFGPLPKRTSLNMKVHSERNQSWFDGFRESYVTYETEDNDTTPAYLLVPSKGKPPFPAVVANHQCFVDCDVGKDAVVGKAHLRPDQAYGFELVNKGFVVLAPDSKNCGERNIKGLRRQGERDKEKCWGAALPYLSMKSFYLKHLWDAVRAVDVLEGLDYVDSKRIGMIGHSLGAGTTFWAAAHDERIKAAVLSCHYLGGFGQNGWGQCYRDSGDGIFYHELLSLISPRACLATRGKLENPIGKMDLKSSSEENAILKWCFDLGQLYCRLDNMPENRMQCRLFDGGHSFPEKERQYAYTWLVEQLK